MQIEHRETNHRGEFFIEQDQNQEALMTYSMKGDEVMVIEHTEVKESLQGKNIGKQLVEKAVDYARTHHLKITPVCSFARAVFDKTPAFQDVLA